MELEMVFRIEQKMEKLMEFRMEFWTEQWMGLRMDQNTEFIEGI
jgi:hypothetical protein